MLCPKLIIISDILEILQINDVSHYFVPYPFPGTYSCILKKDDNKVISWNCQSSTKTYL